MPWWPTTAMTVRRRGPLAAMRHLATRIVGGARVGMPTLDDGLVLMQLRAARGFADGLGATTARRRSLEAMRTVSGYSCRSCLRVGPTLEQYGH